MYVTLAKLPTIGCLSFHTDKFTTVIATITVLSAVHWFISTMKQCYFKENFKDDLRRILKMKGSKTRSKTTHAILTHGSNDLRNGIYLK